MRSRLLCSVAEKRMRGGGGGVSERGGAIGAVSTGAADSSKYTGWVRAQGGGRREEGV